MAENDFTTEYGEEKVLIEAQESHIVTNESVENITTEGMAVSTADVEEAAAVNITVGEVSGASFGTRVVVNHNASDPNQHTIGAITGLREELNEIKRLKTVESDKLNVANYYKWEDASYPSGRFVSLVSEHSTIDLCRGSDIFGVTVDDAGFVGGQDELSPRAESYGLIVTSGRVEVLCELGVKIDDCVVSNEHGYATKSDSKYGYKVIGKVVKDGVDHAVIMLGVQADVTNAIGIELGDIEKRVGVNETNIISAINLANQAYNKATEISSSNQVMSDRVDNALGVVDKVASDVENLENQVSNSTLISAQAKAIAESAATSAESMRNEAVADANKALQDTTELRKELGAAVSKMNTDLENAALELEAAKESIEATRDELKANIDGVSAELENTKNDLNTTRDELSADIDNTNIELNNTREQLQSSIDSTSSELNKAKEELSETTSGFEELKDDLTPLIEWPDAENPTGVAGFVARANEDSATLSTIVTWQGEANDAIAAFKQEVADNYATIDSVTQLKTETTEAITNVKQTADDNKASIDLITSWQGDTNESLAKVSQKADDNEASIKDLVSWKDSASESISSIEQKTTKNEASINSLTAWQDEAKTAITNVEQKASDNEASITNLTAWQGTTNESIAKIEQKANDNESSIKALAQWQGEATQSIAKVEEKANANESSITLLTEWKSDVENDVESIASIKTQSDANKSSIDSLTSWQGTTNESLTSIKQQSDANKASIEAIAVWQGETEESIAVVKQQADDNEASIKTLTEWKDDTNESISSIEQRVDSAESNISSLTSWQGDAKTSIANVEQKSNANESKINSLTSWQGEASESIANVEQKATDNESAITSLTTWQGEANESITSVKQTANQNSADISLIASWKSDVEDDVSSIASIKTTADENKAAIEQLVKKDTELSTTIAGVKTTADANKASIEQITSWQSKVDPTINSVAGIKQTADGNAAKIEGLTTWQGETNVAMARIEQKADTNGAYIQSTVANMDKYAVGPHSQAYGFTLEQAGSVLEEGMIYVPTVSVTEKYEYTDVNKTIQTYTRSFTPQYLYKWGKVSGQYRWITVDKNYTETSETNTSSKAVYFTTTEPAVSGNFGYWYTNGGTITGTTGAYEPYTLYKWDSYVDENKTTQYHWVAVATLAGNSNNRAVSQIRQDANSIELSVTTLDGKYAGTKAFIDDNKSVLQDVVSWKGENGENIATFATNAGDNFASASQVAKIVDKDGNVIESSIVTAVNNNASSISLSADSIEFTGQTLNIKVDATNIVGELTIGQLPDSVAETGDIPTKTSDLTNDSGFQNETGVVTIAKGAITADYIKTLNLEVGNEIKMGANATISWGNVDSKPDDLATTTDVSTAKTEAINAASSDATSKANTAQQNAINTASKDATTKANNAKSGAINEVKNLGYQTASQVTQITKDTVTTTYIKGLNLEVGNEIAMGPNAKITWDNLSEVDVATTTDVSDAKTAAVNEVKGLGYQTSSQVTTITKNEINTATIEAGEMRTTNYGEIIMWDAEEITGASVGLAFTSNGDGTCGVSGMGSCKDLHVIIPRKSPGGDLVTEIKDQAFYFMNLSVSIQKVTIPKRVEIIGKSVFTNCTSLTSVEFEEDSNLCVIGESAFDGCSNLSNITFANNRRLKTIGNSAFARCSSLTSFEIPESVTSIGGYVFQNCTSLTSISIPNGVTGINAYAVNGCSKLTTIMIPKSVINIGSYAFGDTALNTVYYGGYPDEWEKIEKHSTTINNLNSLNPDIYYYSEEKPTDLSHTYWRYRDGFKISCNDGVLNASGANIEGNINATSGRIGGFSLEDGKLTSEYEALTNDIVTGSKTSVTSSLRYVSYLSGYAVASKVDGSSGGYTETEIIIPDEYNGKPVLKISDGAFYDCNNLTSVTIGNNITRIGKQAFYSCDNLKSIMIPDSVEDIQEDAFKKSGIKNIYFGLHSRLQVIGKWAFEGCEKLTKIELHDVVRIIENGAFRNCTSLQQIILGTNIAPGTVKFSDTASATYTYGIHEQAFYGCPASIKICYKGTYDDWIKNELGEPTNYIRSGTTTKFTNNNFYYYDESGTKSGNYWHYNRPSGICISGTDKLISTKYFTLDSDGIITAENANIKGEISSETISAKKIMVMDENKHTHLGITADIPYMKTASASGTLHFVNGILVDYT